MSRIARGQSSTVPADDALPSYAGELLFFGIFANLQISPSFFFGYLQIGPLLPPRCSPW